MRLKNFSLSFGSKFFKALSDESRIRILHLIYANTEMCISDVEHTLDFTQTKTSRHISYMKNAGMLSARHVDQWVFYKVKDEVVDVIHQVFHFMRKDMLLQQDLETYRVLYSNRELAINKVNQRSYRA